MPNLKVIDLFCGAGGFSEGFCEAGFDIIAGIDKDSESLETYSYNFKKAMVFKADLLQSLEEDNKIIKELKVNDVDVILGGPPCQGFSIAGKRKQQDPRNQLYKALLYFIEAINPKAILMENVPTILGLYKGKIAEQIVNDFEKLGYKAKVFTLLASDYGVPQNRKRTFFVGLKTRKPFLTPEPAKLFFKISCEEAISDLPSLENESGAEVLSYICPTKSDYQKMMRKDSVYIYNHWAVEHTERTKRIISMVPDGGNYKDLPEHLQNTRKVNIAWTRMNSKKPCFTIDAGHNHHFHYKANRVPTVRECARIQSFPDRFRFFGKKTSQFRQVGNAVPPLLVKAIAIELKKALNNG